MILTAQQPVYLPWLGLFEKIAAADQFCYLDIVQYQRGDFNNRNKIKTTNGEIWLTVPVDSKKHFETVICEAKIINDGWRRKHFQSIQLAYSKAPYFNDYCGELEAIVLNGQQALLADLNFDILQFMLRCLAIETLITKATEHNFSGEKSGLVLDMCKKLGAKEYIFGAQGKDYADEAAFEEAGVKIRFQDYKHPKYNQLHGDFLPYMSVIDLLFNEGKNSKNILLSGN